MNEQLVRLIKKKEYNSKKLCNQEWNIDSTDLKEYWENALNSFIWMNLNIYIYSMKI